VWRLQSPNEILDWHQDWTDWMELNDDISTSEWSIFPAGPTLSADSIDTSGMLTTVFVEDLELGKSYQLRNTITTSQGRTGIREITLRCDVQS
jgi:hypothetical protein